MVVLAALVAASLTWMSAPYGRHARPRWGPLVPTRLAWIGMEMPALALFAAVILGGSQRSQTAVQLLAGAWLLHYAHRTLIYPLRIPASAKGYPLLIAAIGFIFNAYNAWLNAEQLAEYGQYGEAWLADGRLWLGLAVMTIGMVINVRADNVLLHLRGPGETGYRIPSGALHDQVASPNYFGEVLEWSGWALATWSLAGVAFALFTLANLGPRAVAHLRWYRQNFPDYPRERKALIPYVF